MWEKVYSDLAKWFTDRGSSPKSKSYIYQSGSGSILTKMTSGKLIFKVACLIVLFNPMNLKSLYAQGGWELSFEDTGTSVNWTDKWFLDGKTASVNYTSEGMLFKAGGVINDHASHAVLWTNKSFTGDIKIEYDFTRVDTSTNDVVVIAYILAEGIGDAPFSKDISKWKDLRIIPFMHIYWWGMNAIHVSYATRSIGKDNYIRVRKYPVHPGSVTFKETEVSPSFSGDDLFKPNVCYHLTFIKSGNTLIFEVKGDDKTKIFVWETDRFASVRSGRFGLRQMWGRNSLYKNLKIFTKP